MSVQHDDDRSAAEGSMSVSVADVTSQGDTLYTLDSTSTQRRRRKKDLEHAAVLTPGSAMARLKISPYTQPILAGRSPSPASSVRSGSAGGVGSHSRSDPSAAGRSLSSRGDRISKRRVVGTVEDDEDFDVLVAPGNDGLGEPTVIHFPESLDDDARGTEPLTVEETQAIQRDMIQAERVVAFPISRPRPALPNIDDHVQRDDLKISNMTASLRAEKGVDTLNRIMSPIATKRRRPGGIHRRDVRRFVCFLKTFRRTGKGPVSLPELSAAIRKYRRAKAGMAMERRGRDLVKRLQAVMNQHGLTLEEWFSGLDQSQAGQGDGRLTVLELREGLAFLTVKLKGLRFTSGELTVMLKYLDPNGDGDLELRELQSGFLRADGPLEGEQVSVDAGPVMDKFLAYMNDSNLRVSDIFKLLDWRGLENITTEDVQKALEEICSEEDDEDDPHLSSRMVRRTSSSGSGGIRRFDYAEVALARMAEEQERASRERPRSRSPGSPTHSTFGQSQQSRSSRNPPKGGRVGRYRPLALNPIPSRPALTRAQQVTLNQDWLSSFDAKLRHSQHSLSLV